MKKKKMIRKENVSIDVKLVQKSLKAQARK